MSERDTAHNRASVFDPLASAYDAWFEEEGRLIFAIEVQAFQELLPLLSKPWLEIGVGSGRFAEALGIETGLDPSIKLLEMARSRGVEAFLGRGENIPFEDGSFRTVFLIVTLCFADSPLGVLRETNRLLKRDGKIVLGLVLRESPWGRFYEAKKEKGHRSYQHATFYSYAEVAQLLEEAGFVVERVLSTLFQKPGEAEYVESPQEGFSPDAGFTMALAGKLPVEAESPSNAREVK